MVVGKLVVGIELEGMLKVFDGGRVLVELLVSDPKIEVNVDVVGVEFEGLKVMG